MHSSQVDQGSIQAESQAYQSASEVDQSASQVAQGASQVEERLGYSGMENAGCPSHAREGGAASLAELWRSEAARLAV